MVYVRIFKHICRLPSILLELPFSVVERADLTGLQPSRNAMKMEGMIANTPSDGALLLSRIWIRLAFDAPDFWSTWWNQKQIDAKFMIAEFANFIVMNKNAQNFHKSWMKDVQIHDVVSTNRAVVNYDVPSPERHCIPLLDFKSLLRCCWLNENTNNSWNTHSKHIFDVFWKFEKENLSTVAGLAHSDSRR